MTVNVQANGMKAELDNANPNTLSQHLQKLRFGSLLRSMKTTLIKKVPAVAPQVYQLATLDTIFLADDAKAAIILRAYARTTTAAGPLGEMTVAAFGVTPTTGQIAVSPSGDIVTLGTDAYTAIDIVYEPLQHDVVEFTANVVAGVVTIPTQYTNLGVLALIEAEVVTGTVTGKKNVLVPLAGGGAGLPATTKAQLTSALTTVSFNSATDVPLTARVKLAVALSANIDALLTNITNTY